MDGMAAQLESLRREVESLRRREARYRVFFESSRRAQLVLDLQGRVREANGAAERLFGHAGGGLAGRGFFELLLEEDHAAVAASLVAWASGGSEGEAREARGRSRDGTPLCLNLRGRAGEAGEILVSADEISAARRVEALRAGEREVLRLIAAGRPLAEILSVFVGLMEAQCAGMRGSVLLLDGDGTSLRHGAAPTLPETYTHQIDGAAIGPRAGSCGTACFRGSRVVVGDIAADPLWAGPYAELALRHGLKACWSEPILGGSGQILGTFAMYYGEPRLPGNEELRLIEVAAQLAGLAIERQRALDALFESAQRQRLSFEQAAIGMVELTTTGALVRANRRFCDIFGYSEAELLGRTLGELMPPEAGAGPHQDDFSLEKRLSRRDGGTVWVSVTGGVVRDAEGRPECIVAAVKDVSDRKAFEQALTESEQYNRSLFDSSPIGLVLSTLNGLIVDCNPAYARIVGRSIEEVLTPGFHPRAVPGHPEAEPRAMAELRERGWFSPFEQEYMHPDGHGVLVRVAGRRVERGGARFAISSVEDITARRQAEDEVRRLNGSLEERVKERTAALSASNRELEAFSYSVSHDLRAPLRALDGFSHLLAEEFGEQLGEQGQEYLRRIRRASQRMGDLIDDLIELARISRHKLSLQRVELSAMVKDIARELTENGGGRQVEWHVQADLSVQGDPALLRPALENLLRNAWKFTAYQPAAVIEFGSREAEGELRFFVRDNGAGFDMRYKDRLFTAFQRLHTPARFEGSGVGLAIVARVIARHGGRVWGTGKPEEGAEFGFTLP